MNVKSKSRQAEALVIAHHGAKNLTNTGLPAPTVSAKLSLSSETGGSARVRPMTAATSRQTENPISKFSFLRYEHVRQCGFRPRCARTLGGTDGSSCCQGEERYAAPLCGSGCALWACAKDSSVCRSNVSRLTPK